MSHSFRKLPEDIQHIKLKLQIAINQGLIENKSLSDYIQYAVKGTGGSISEKWNMVIYEKKTKGGYKGTHSIVTVDDYVLKLLLEENIEALIPPEGLKCVALDDAGWGFPLGSVMVGITDGEEVKTKLPPISSFRSPNSVSDGIREYTNAGIELLSEFNVSPSTHHIEICSGYVNLGIREALREAGYFVKVVQISGLLQDKLEGMYKNYILKETGQDIYYDPKELIDNGLRDNIPKLYYAALQFGKQSRPDLLKTSWSSISI